MSCFERLGNGNLPPFTGVPAAAVVSAGTWQTSQPTLANSASPFLAGSGRGLPRVAGRGFGRAHEACEVIDVSEAVCIGLVVWFGHRVAQVGHFIRKERAGNSHFVEVGIAENDRRLACWFFQPKRPTRVTPGTQ